MMNPKTPRPRLCWTNILFFGAAPLLAALAVAYLVAAGASPLTIGLGLLWYVICGLSITAGYHRHFAHPTHKAAWPLRAFYLLFGAASVQHSALKWSSVHRVHHSDTDKDDDTYDARRGFWWSHIGWILFKDERTLDLAAVPDLANDRLVRFQHRHIVLMGIVGGAVLPAALGLLWGDPIGAVLCAGFLRLVFQWHATFCVNSLAHMLGTQPYSGIYDLKQVTDLRLVKCKLESKINVAKVSECCTITGSIETPLVWFCCQTYPTRFLNAHLTILAKVKIKL